MLAHCFLRWAALLRNCLFIHSTIPDLPTSSSLFKCRLRVSWFWRSFAAVLCVISLFRRFLIPSSFLRFRNDFAVSRKEIAFQWCKKGFPWPLPLASAVSSICQRFYVRNRTAKFAVSRKLIDPMLYNIGFHFANPICFHRFLFPSSFFVKTKRRCFPFRGKTSGRK